MKRAAMIAAALAAIVAAYTPAASAGVSCSTDAAAAIAGASVNGPRSGWTPPVWTFDMPSMSMSVDVQADTLGEAQGKALAWLQGEVQRACDAAAAQGAGAGATGSSGASTASAPAVPTVEQTAQADATVAGAAATYVGNSWGPTPIWRITLPNGNTIDVAAHDETEARAAASAYIATELAAKNPTTQPADTAPVLVDAATGTASASVVPADAPKYEPVPLDPCSTWINGTSDTAPYIGTLAATSC